MKTIQAMLLAGACSVALLLQPARQAQAAEPVYPGMPNGTGTHAELATLLQEFLESEDPARARRGKEEEVAGSEVFPDYSQKAIEERRARLREQQARLDKMGVASWNRHQQVDFLAVRARLNQQEFTLGVSRPWQRDPGFYADQILRITFTELPVKGDKLKETRRQLRAIPGLVAQAKSNLNDVAADYADLTLFNLRHPDGVEHGYPYRASPPPGIIGWYADLLGRAEKQQRELRADVIAAKAAVEDFESWLRTNRPRMTGIAGVGRANFDWYLKNVKLMPFNADQIVTLGGRELNRLWALYALEQHRNRNEPPLNLSASAEEYTSRIRATDERIRKFLVDEEIITIPAYIKELDTNVPWIVRAKGPNFWEQVQYRDPSPDHLHAVIPGHRFDGIVERHSTDPIRAALTDGARVEGWGVYLEEGMLHAGLFEAKPRVRELIYLFGIFRAARVSADVWLQLNQMKIADVVKYWVERTPYLDADVARVDAEIYIRRPPGYGLGYMIGMLQMQELLADRKRQLGDKFVLKEFHDQFMATGRLPISLVRWEITGLDDEVRHFWQREPLPASP